MLHGNDMREPVDRSDQSAAQPLVVQVILGYEVR